MTKIEKAKLEAEKRVALLFVLERVYDNIEDMMHWDAMEVIMDENGDAVRDEDGKSQWREPEPGDWEYSTKIQRKEAYDKILTHLEKLL